MIIRLFLIFILFLPNISIAEDAPLVQASIVSPTGSFRPGVEEEIGINFVIHKGWHLYWKNPGDSGLPPKIRWKLPTGWSIGDIRWPAPRRIQVGPLVNYGYDDELLLASPLRTGPTTEDSVEIEASVEWLVCKEDCIPGEAILKRTFPVSEIDTPSNEKQLFDSVSLKYPSTVFFKDVSAQVSNSEFTLLFPSDSIHKNFPIYFFPEQSNFIEHSGVQKRVIENNTLRLSIPRSTNSTLPDTLRGVLQIQAGPLSIYHEINPVETTAISKEVSSFGLVLLFAFLGGILLNLMPCVFPVLSIKAFGLLQNLKNSHAKPLLHQGIPFTLGVVGSCVSLALLISSLRAAGESVGWGFQLQSPTFVSLMALFFFFLAMILWGAIEFSFVVGSSRTSQSEVVESFFSGIVTTLVATPCTAPFMGSALAYGLSSSTPRSVLIFATLGFGIAFPYLILTAFPKISKLLPRPGAWMVTTQKLLSIPLFLSVIWLLWVFGRQSGSDQVVALLTALLVFFFAFSIPGRTIFRKTCRYGLIGFSIFLAVSAAALSPKEDTTSDGPWEKFSTSKLHSLTTSGKAVFVDFTASWCITCQANKRLVLNTETVLSAFKARGVVLLKADWTSRDAEITKALRSVGREGVPVYALYLPNRNEPILLPSLLTQGVVLDNLAQFLP